MKNFASLVSFEVMLGLQYYTTTNSVGRLIGIESN